MLQIVQSQKLLFSCYQPPKNATINLFHRMENLIEDPQKYGIGSVTLYQIEVRASSKQYDIQAQQVAREILVLPGKHLPSLAAISASTSPLTISTSQLYYFTGQLTPTQIDHL